MRPLAAASLVAIACATSPAVPSPPPQEAPDYATLIGDCDGGTQITAEGLEEGPAYEVGDLADYTLRLRIRDVPEGYVRARADAHWNDDRRNVLGYLPAGAVVSAWGPTKDTEGSGGLGYAIPVRDLGGRTCRVYVSYTVIDPSTDLVFFGAP